MILDEEYVKTIRIEPIFIDPAERLQIAKACNGHGRGVNRPGCETANESQ
jgi:hypothetical protein